MDQGVRVPSKTNISLPGASSSLDTTFRSACSSVKDMPLLVSEPQDCIIK